MTLHIALIRGINVGGHRKIKMADLRALCAEIGLEGVETYIQSGNLVFEGGKRTPQELERAIAGAIADAYGFDVGVRALSARDLARLIAANPFTRGDSCDPAYLHVTLLDGNQPDDAAERLTPLISGDEDLRLGDRAIYLYCPHGYGRSKLTNPAIERKLGLAATTRNWRTLNTLLKMAESRAD